MQTITAVIPAHNEEVNIERCLKSLQWCDNIQVLSTGTDKTAEIAQHLGAEVVIKARNTTDDFTLVQKNINWAIDTAKTDWILRIDADEVVPSELKEEILQILNHSSVADKTPVVAYGIPRKQYFLDGFLTGGDWAYDRLIRLFRPQCARYEPIVQVHEQFKVDGPIDYCTHALEHYSHPTIQILLQKFDIYTTMEAKQLNISKSKAFIRMILRPPYIFLRWMIWNKGYKDGVRGVKAAFYRGWYDYLVFSKYLNSKTSSSQQQQG